MIDQSKASKHSSGSHPLSTTSIVIDT